MRSTSGCVGAHHPVQPPAVGVAPQVLGRERVAVVVDRRGTDELRRGRAQQLVDGCVEPHLARSGRRRRGAGRSPRATATARPAPGRTRLGPSDRRCRSGRDSAARGPLRPASNMSAASGLGACACASCVASSARSARVYAYASSCSPDPLALSVGEVGSGLESRRLFADERRVCSVGVACLSAARSAARSRERSARTAVIEGGG